MDNNSEKQLEQNYAPPNGKETNQNGSAPAENLIKTPQNTGQETQTDRQSENSEYKQTTNTAKNQPTNPQAVQIVYAPKKEKRPVTPATKLDILFGALGIICCVLAVDWALFGGFALGFTLSYTLLLVLTVIYLAVSKAKFKVFPIICSVFSLGSAGVFAVYRDPAVNFVLFFTTAALYCIMLAGLGQTNRFSFGSYGVLIDILRTSIVVPFRFLAEPFRSLSAYLSGKKSGKRLVQALFGIALAVPALVVILPLLISSDAVFEHVMKTILGNFVEYIIKILMGFAISPFLISLLFAHAKGLDKKQNSHTGQIKFHRFEAPVFNAFLGAISVFYIIYLISQLAYISKAFKGLLPEGEITAAEFARRGFFEMAVISFINLGLICFTLLLSKRRGSGSFYVSTKILCSFIGLFTLFIISTAFAKMYIYIQRFGMTRLRILTSVFMVLLGFMVISILIRVFAKRFPYMKAVIISCMVLGLAVSYIDIDTTIARYNTQAYETGKLKTIDVQTIGELSDAGVPYLIRLLDDKDETVRNQAKYELYQKYVWRFCRSPYSNSVRAKEYKDKFDFRSYNMVKNRANKLLYENYDRFSDAKDMDYPYENNYERGYKENPDSSEQHSSDISSELVSQAN